MARGIRRDHPDFDQLLRRIAQSAAHARSLHDVVFRCSEPTYATEHDLLTGDGIAIQVTRFRILSLPPGQDNRPTIGIQFQPDRGDWYFSSPFVALSIAGRSYIADIDQALVFARGDRPIFPEKLGSDQQRYQLPSGEKRFFRLRFSVNQSEYRGRSDCCIMTLIGERIPT